MKLCCIILNYFGRSNTVRCVKDLLNQHALEKIIIVENSTSRIEFNFLNAKFKNDMRVDILAPSKNLGFAGGVNFAIETIKHLQFDAFLLLNDDTVVPSGTVPYLANSMAEGDFDLLSPIIYCHPKKEKIWAKGQYYNRYFGLIAHRSIPFLPGNIFYLSGCCILIHWRVFEKIGLLDTSFFMYGEDVEFCHRAVQSGFRLGVVDIAHIYHKGNISSQLNSFFYEHHMNKGHLLLCKKLSRNKTDRKLSFIIKIFSLAVRAIYRSFKYKNTNAIDGYKQALFDIQKN